MNGHDVELERMPPQDVEAEQAVLGACLIGRRAIDEARALLAGGSEWYHAPHRVIWDAIVALADAGTAVDQVTLCDALRRAGTLEQAGGLVYVVKLACEVATVANASYHARIVAKCYQRRRLIELTRALERQAYEGGDEIDAVLDQAERQLVELAGNGDEGAVLLEQVLAETIAEIEQIQTHPSGVVGVRTGFPDLDRMTGGFQRGDLFLIAARPSMGKCLGKGTKVLMYDGSLKAVESVIAGERLMGPDSRPRRVLSTSRGRGPMYLVRQARGFTYRVNAAHILALKRSESEGPHRRGDDLFISAEEYSRRGPGFQSRYKGFKVVVEFQERQLPIEPYFLGVWLSDGHTNSVRITTCDVEVIAYLHEYAARLGLQVSVYEDDYAISNGRHNGQKGRRHSLQATMRDMGLLGYKHIPADFVANSTANRMQLLAGLLDSDGYYQPRFRGYEITQTREGLARQIKFLADSLGFSTSINGKTTSIKSLNYQGHAYRVRISGDVHAIPCRVARRKAQPPGGNCRWSGHRHIGVKVTPDGINDFYGFCLDGDHLFLLEDMTVTHNSALGLKVADRAAMDGHRVLLFSTEMRRTKLATRLLAIRSKVPAIRISIGDLGPADWAAITNAAAELARLPIRIDHRGDVSVPQIASEAARRQRQEGVDLIIVDHIGEIAAPAKATNREQEVSQIAKGLKRLARRLDVPVVAMSQLNRAVEARNPPRPELYDLRDSGGLEEAADVVLFIYRPEYYHKPTLIHYSDGERVELPAAGLAELIIAKQRSGPTGSILARWDAALTAFTPYELDTRHAVPLDLPWETVSSHDNN